MDCQLNSLEVSYLLKKRDATAAYYQNYLIIQLFFKAVDLVKTNCEFINRLSRGPQIDMLML